MEFRKIIILSITFLGSYTLAGSTPNVSHVIAMVTPDYAQHDPGQQGGSDDSTAQEEGTTDIFAGWNEFPNLHPMVVHFPIVLLIIAFLSQLIGLFVMKQELSWVTLVLLFLAVIGGLVAAKIAHAHPHDLPERIHQIFEEHEWYAMATLWISGITFILKVVSHFFIKNNRWLEIVLTIAIFLSAVTVSITGHLGSQMVFIENVGPQGNYLKDEHGH